MKELKQILCQHGARYPYMQPTDAVKLIYQNEFGGGHLIRDRKSCLEYIHREYAMVSKDAELAKYEALGNGILRVHLAALQECELDQLGEDFIHCAEAHRGDPQRFLQKLEVLREVTAEGVFSFTSQELENYLTAYAQAGFPAVSHSEQYRQHYHPAYRVIRK